MQSVVAQVLVVQVQAGDFGVGVWADRQSCQVLVVRWAPPSPTALWAGCLRDSAASQ